MQAIEMLMTVSDKFGTEIDYAEFFREPCIRRLAQLLDAAAPDAAPAQREPATPSIPARTSALWVTEELSAPMTRWSPTGHAGYATSGR